MSTNTNLEHVGDNDFGSKVLQSETPVIVDFWASWCGPCRAIAPVFEQLSTQYEGKLKFAKLDVDANPNVSGSLSIQAIPTLLIFKGGQPVGRIVGPHPARLKTEIDRVLAENGIAVG